MPNVEADRDQIAMFKLGAAARYKERGVDGNTADRLFELHMAKIAEEQERAVRVEQLTSRIRDVLSTKG